MSQAEFAVNFFIALIDPVGNVPRFAAATAGARPRDRTLIALYISLFVFGFVTVFYFTGLTIVVRVLGLILCALAAQFILAGLAQSTLGLINPHAANPYGR